MQSGSARADETGRLSVQQRWAVTLLAGLLILPPAFLHPMASVDEALYASTARNMLQRGDWLTFYYNGHPFWDKPPVTMWLMGISFSLFGVSEFTARLPIVLCALGCVALVMEFGRRLGGGKQGMFVGLGAGLFLLTSQDFLRFSAKAQTDIPLTLLLVAQMYGFWRALEQPRWHLFSGVCLGLALATKNQAGAFALLAQGAYMVVGRDLRPARERWWYTGLALAALVALPWFAHQYWIHGEPFLRTYLHYSYGVFVYIAQVQRETQGGVDYFFYARYLLERQIVTFVALAGSLGWAFWRLGRGWLAPGAWRQWSGNHDAPVTLLAVWTFTIFALCTFCGRSHYWYLIPMYPAVALLLACLLARVPAKEWQQRGVLAVFAGWAVIYQVSYYIPPPKEPILWATKLFAPAVRATANTGEMVYILEPAPHVTGKERQRRLFTDPACHFYFDRPITIVRPEAWPTIIDNSSTLLVVVSQDDWETSYGAHVPALATVEPLGQYQNFTCYRLRKPAPMAWQEPKPSSQR